MDLLSSWISDINKEGELAEAKRRSPVSRQEAAFCARTVADADALCDLVENPDDPFLFRKWLQLRIAEGPADIRDCKSQRRQEIIEEYCGLQVLKLLGCGDVCSGYFRINPDVDWQYSSGEFSIRAYMSRLGCQCGKPETRTYAGTMPQGPLRWN